MNLKILSITPHFRRDFLKNDQHKSNFELDKLECVFVNYQILDGNLMLDGTLMISGDEFTDWVKSLFEKKIENWGFEKNVRENH